MGQGAAERKYDLLTALGAWGMGQGGAEAMLALRLSTLITARYNWRRDELTTGQREIAALWSVDTRTVKRQMARLRELGWLVLVRQGARGRVAVYRLNTAAILHATRDSFANVGPDFLARMTGDGTGNDSGAQPDGQARKQAGNVVRFPGIAEPDGQDAGWARISDRLQRANPHTHAAWIAGLAGRVEEDRLILRAPSRFHARHVSTHLRDTIYSMAALDGIRRISIEGIDR
ncbi:hypothetical protein G8E03_17080 (plasmid) [Pontibrevibacter nitratireducens]|uniref:DnaA N-terminal domain-containing protein n=2 Tax=Pontivivens nitratireducens TaxID=2758038 RepID=A0A6G7VRP9_9RHOB|nr:hypothetical protein G8E03_17080 [Pontibrevibacter nitratireducens]